MLNPLRGESMDEDDDLIERLERRRDRKARARQVRLLLAGGGLLFLVIVACVAALAVIERKKRGVAPDGPTEVKSDSGPIGISGQATRAGAKPKYYFDVGGNRLPRLSALATFREDQLRHEFQENELKAMKAYRGERFYLSGHVGDMSVQNMEVTTLTIGWPGFGSILCSCSSHDDLLLKIKAGIRFDGKKYTDASNVLLEGTCVNPSLFEDCRVVEILN
jgi:hypothetical protein